MAEKLYALAREAAQLTGGETVWDLYCGIGTIGLSMASQALTVWGIEVSEESVACALENAELNDITNAAFFAGNVGQVTQELLDRSGQPDVVVVDPPRAGLAGKALRRLGEIGAPRLVYVSCNPTTLAGGREAAAATSTATSSCAPARSTCSRTRRTSSAWRCSNVRRRRRRLPHVNSGDTEGAMRNDSAPVAARTRRSMRRRSTTARTCTCR